MSGVIGIQNPSFLFSLCVLDFHGSLFLKITLAAGRHLILVRTTEISSERGDHALWLRRQRLTNTSQKRNWEAMALGKGMLHGLGKTPLFRELHFLED